VGELLAQERDDGMAVSALYPANAALYRHLGYEYAGLHPGFRAPVADIPPARAEVAEMGSADLDGVIACFSRFAAAHNGPVQPKDRARWETDVLGPPGEGTHQRTVVVAGAPGDIAGYASYFLENAGGNGYRVACKHLVAVTAPALTALLGYFRRFENAAAEIAWFGPPTGGVVGLALATSTFALQPTLNRWMGRILDVPRALEGRGYPDVSGELVLELSDPLFPGQCRPLARARCWRAGHRHARARSVTGPGPSVADRTFLCSLHGFCQRRRPRPAGRPRRNRPKTAASVRPFQRPRPLDARLLLTTQAASRRKGGAPSAGPSPPEPLRDQELDTRPDDLEGLGIGTCPWEERRDHGVVVRPDLGQVRTS
jgi:hypothetical protein